MIDTGMRSANSRAANSPANLLLPYADTGFAEPSLALSSGPRAASDESTTSLGGLGSCPHCLRQVSRSQFVDLKQSLCLKAFGQASEMKNRVKRTRRQSGLQCILVQHIAELRTEAQTTESICDWRIYEPDTTHSRRFGTGVGPNESQQTQTDR